MDNQRSIAKKWKRIVEFYAFGAGLVALGIGAAGMILFGMILLKSCLFPIKFDVKIFSFAAALLVIAVFFLHIGWRFILNRPNRYGSMLTPIGWRVLGLIFLALFCFAVFSVGTKLMSLHVLSNAAIPLVSYLTFSYGCFLSARRAANNGQKVGLEKSHNGL